MSTERTLDVVEAEREAATQAFEEARDKLRGLDLERAKLVAPVKRGDVFLDNRGKRCVCTGIAVKHRRAAIRYRALTKSGALSKSFRDPLRESSGFYNCNPTGETVDEAAIVAAGE